MNKSISSFEFIQRYIHPINGGYTLRQDHRTKAIKLFHNHKFVKDIIFDEICKLLYAYDFRVKWGKGCVREIIYTF